MSTIVSYDCKLFITVASGFTLIYHCHSSVERE